MSDKASKKKTLTFMECMTAPKEEPEYAELIAELRYMEDVCKQGKSCPVPCQNECLFKQAADALEVLI